MPMKINIVSVTLFFLSAFSASLSHSSYHSDDQDALLDFKNSLSLDPYNSLHNWFPNHTTCNWTGVNCSSRRQRVVSLNLTSMGLVGPISPLVGNLSFLGVLDLTNNNFQGHLPYQLGKLFRLRELLLSTNDLGGSIPSSLGGCRSLQFLGLSQNHLKGSVPSQLGLLGKLEKLLLGVNNLTGTIPSSLANLSSLTDLDLRENRLHSGIPVDLGMLTQLKLLILYHNYFTGPVPTALSNCSHLRVLALDHNYLTGHIPWQFGKLSEMQRLLLWGNQLTGEIPSSLSNCTTLQLLELEFNNLSGAVPLELGNLLKLRWLNLWGNYLVSGSRGLVILTALTNCSNLEHIDLSQNYFTGIIPTSVGLFSSSLSYFLLPDNEIEGRIPDEIGNLTNLQALDLSGNRLNGTIPWTLSTLRPNLERMNMRQNKLYGRISKCWGQAKMLGLLSLSENMLSGTIPHTLGNLTQLRYIYFAHNQLSGQIPASLGRCQTLVLVDLAYNNLTGNIPPEVAGLPNLQFYFNVSNNFLQGSLLEMSTMIMVQAIDVSFNRFSAGVPSALASCVALEYLNLSWNALQGPIPASLANLKNLQYMDLSCNNLSGTIPVAFQEMKMLRHLNLSSNMLFGEVPNRGVFATLDASDIMGNLGLCGTGINLPPCSHSKHKHKQVLATKKVIIPVVIAITIFIMSFLLLAFSYGRRDTSTLALEVRSPRITYEDLVDATGGFSEENLIGTGSFGSVYKGILNNTSNIAVKVFNLQDENVRQSFSTECNALKRVRHRNVIKIISSCSNLDFKALVLPFMSSGSLERWLHPQGGDECKLNLSNRLRIAMEIVQGMSYLHHHYFVQVIHCDLKPSNVLLGDDMTPYIADFGIARLLFGDSVDSLNSTNILKGSIGYIAPDMMGKEKPKKDTAKEIAAKVDAPTTSRGGGRAGLADRTGGEKGGDAKFQCPLCKVTAPDIKTMQIHHEAKHPKLPYEESKIVNMHAIHAPDPNKGRPGVRGSLMK